MKLDTIRELLHAEVISKCSNPDIDIKFAKASDLMSDVLAFSQPFTKPEAILITGLTNKQVVRTCDIAGVCAIVFVRGKKPSAETVRLAEDCNITILTTKLKMYEACGVLYSKGIGGVPLKKQNKRG